MKTLGIDIGGTSIKFGIVDGVEVLSHSEFENNYDDTDALIYKLKEVISNAKENEKIKSVGIAFPGFVDCDGIVKSAPNLKYLESQNLYQLLSIEDIDISVENDAYLAALAESKVNPLEEYYFITLGTGIGSSLIKDKKVVKSKSGSSGELGHTVLNYKEAGDDYRSGIFESYFNNQQFVSRARSDIKDFPNSVLNSIDEFTAREISDASVIGDDLAIITMMEMGKILGIGLSSVANLTGIPIFVIGGGISNLSSLLFDIALKTMRERVIPELRDKVEIRISKNRNFAGIIGSAVYTEENK
jgi:glucokinase